MNLIADFISQIIPGGLQGAGLDSLLGGGTGNPLTGVDGQADPFFSLLTSQTAPSTSTVTVGTQKDKEDISAVALLGLLQQQGLVDSVSGAGQDGTLESILPSSTSTGQSAENKNQTALDVLSQLYAIRDAQGTENLDGLENAQDALQNVNNLKKEIDNFVSSSPLKTTFVDEPVQAVLAKIPNATILATGEPDAVGKSVDELQKTQSANTISFAIASGKAIGIAEKAEQKIDIGESKLAEIARQSSISEDSAKSNAKIAQAGDATKDGNAAQNNHGDNKNLLAYAGNLAAQGVGDDSLPDSHAKSAADTIKQVHAFDQKASDLTKITNNINQENSLKSHNNIAEQVNFKVINAVKNGESRINIQLEPANLGKVDVSIDMKSDGKVSVVVMADKSDTLDMLQRDSRSLERALQNAGLKTDSGSLSFNLRNGENNQQTFRDFAANSNNYGRTAANDEIQSIVQAGSSSGSYNIYASDRLLDIRV